MRLFNEALSFASETTAIRKLDKSLEKFGLKREQVNWLLAVRADGRFVPVVQVRQHQTHLTQLAHMGVGVM